jgi:hypothetical protein
MRMVSPLCLGTVNFGPRTDEKESFAIMDKALEADINFFDTANVYVCGDGKSELLTANTLNKKAGKIICLFPGFIRITRANEIFFRAATHRWGSVLAFLVYWINHF